MRIILRQNLKLKISPFLPSFPYFYPKQFNLESKKYIINREFIKERDKTVNELMQKYSSSSPARDTTISDAHQKWQQIGLKQIEENTF